MKNALLFFGLLWLMACSSTRPSVVATGPEEPEEPIGKELVLRRPAPYYARPDSTMAPAAVLPMSAQTLYIVGRRARWYRSQYAGHPAYYVLVYYFYPPGQEPRAAVPVVPASGLEYHNTQVGPRGGVYYINKNGNKTYIKH